MARPFIWYHDLDPLTFEFGPLFQNFNLGRNFWLVGGRAFLFHVCIPSGKTFHLIPWPWLTDFFTFFLKTLTLVINTCKTHSLNALLHWNFRWDKRNSANFETFGGALSDLLSLLVKGLEFAFGQLLHAYTYIIWLIRVHYNNSCTQMAIKCKTCTVYQTYHRMIWMELKLCNSYNTCHVWWVLSVNRGCLLHLGTLILLLLLSGVCVSLQLTLYTFF
jgi:hypothetical protein